MEEDYTLERDYECLLHICSDDDDHEFTCYINGEHSVIVCPNADHLWWIYNPESCDCPLPPFHDDIIHSVGCENNHELLYVERTSCLRTLYYYACCYIYGEGLAVLLTH